MNKNELKPACVFEQFAKINQIPRPSKHEEKMIEYLKEFGKSHQLETQVDETGNVLIRKPATPGMDNCPVVILQSHMDMVCEKLVDIDFDFDKDAIQTYIDGEWLCAKGTTLGADDGIGCAIELAILESKDIQHGPIECVFTRDEETGLTGAIGMKPGFMTGNMLINLDSEDEGQIFVSCAGGRNTTAIFQFERENIDTSKWFFMQGSLKGLVGGHSGDDINKKRANALKILARFLYQTQERYGIRLVFFNAGKLHNAIPRDGIIKFAIPVEYKENVRADWNIFVTNIEEEYHVTENSMKFSLESSDASKVINPEVSRRLIQAMQAVDNGVFAMCQDKELEWLVETSNNVASIETHEDKVKIVASQRSNVMSALDNQAATVKATFQLASAEVVQGEGYPAWKMNPDSKLTALAVDTYKKLFNKEPKVLGIHAGLECGLFSEKYPRLDMISFGPTLRGVHSPDERLLIPTVQMVWDHLLEILKNISKL